MTNDRRVLVCDLDNTLYDWVGYFVSAFYAMVEEVIRITGCDREQLLNDFRAVHRQHHDAEHPFALLETSTVKRLFPGQSRSAIAEHLDSAFHAFNLSRKENLRLYPGVREGLDGLTDLGFVLCAHTESKLFGVVDRLTRLNLTGYFHRIYCRERPEGTHPNPEAGARWLDAFPMHKVVELSHHQRKPDPDVLLEICRDLNVAPEDTAYVGDSVARDVLMAKTAGVYAIWAKYGSHHGEHQYQQLVRVSHWTDKDVARERELSRRAKSVMPDYVLEESFSEILEAISVVDGGDVATRARA